MIEKIFHPKPQQWGLRGDPYLWIDMKSILTSTVAPDTVDDFEELFIQYFHQITGEELSDGKDIYVEKYSHGGMSSGMICSSFWIHVGLPLLKERYQKLLNSKKYNQV